MIPLSVSISALITVASFTFTPLVASMVISCPCKVFTFMTPERSVDLTFPSIPWYKRIPFNFSGSLSNAFKVLEGILEKASSVGAKIVKGPPVDNVSTRPATSAAFNKVEKLPAFLATCTIFGIINILFFLICKLKKRNGTINKYHL